MSSCVAGIMLDLGNKTAIGTQSCPLGAHSLVGDPDPYKPDRPPSSKSEPVFKERSECQGGDYRQRCRGIRRPGAGPACGSWTAPDEAFSLASVLTSIK